MILDDVPSVVLRGDASGGIGTGHVARLSAVAAALLHRGVASALATVGPPPRTGPLPVRLIDRTLSADRDPEAELAPEEQRRDALATLALGPEAIRTVVVDHYGLGSAWEEELRSAGVATVMAIDDLPHRPHAVDLLVDPNLGPTGSGPVLTTGGRTLRGPAYAPLGPDYIDVVRPERADGRPRILITLGGGATGAAPQVADLLSRERRLEDVGLEFIVPDAAERNAVRAALDGRRHVEVRGRIPSLTEPLGRSDLVLGGGGTTVWQRLRLGVPGVMLALAPNQVRVCRAVAAAGLGVWAGEGWGRPDRALGSLVAEALTDAAAIERTRLVGPLVVDGRGADRVAIALGSTASPPEIRTADPSDAAALLAIANDDDVRLSSRDPRPIDPVAHLGWLAERLKDPSSLLLVATSHDLVVGQARFELLRGADGDGTWEVSYALDAAARGRGWAEPMLAAAIRELRARRPRAGVVGVVRDGNQPSHAAFRRLGFDHDPLGRRAVHHGAAVGPGFSAYLLGAGTVTA